MKKNATQQQLRGASETRKNTKPAHYNSSQSLSIYPTQSQQQLQQQQKTLSGSISQQMWMSKSDSVQGEYFFDNQNYQTGQQQKAQDSSLSIPMKKFFGHAPQYRNANQSQSQTSINSKIQNVQQKFWQDVSKSDKSLMRIESGKSRPVTAGQFKPLTRAFSMPKFKNEMLQNHNLQSIKQEEFDEREYPQFQENVAYEGQIQNAVQNLNSQVNFQRIVNIHQQPFQFLSHVGGKYTSIKNISSEEANNIITKDLFPTKILPVQQMNQYEQLQMFKKIDIDRNINDQISKHAKVPTVVRPSTAVQSAHSQAKSSSQSHADQIPSAILSGRLSSSKGRTQSQATLSAKQQTQVQGLPQAQQNFGKSRNIQTATANMKAPGQKLEYSQSQNTLSQKNSQPSSANQQRLLSGKQQRIQSAKPELMRRLQDKNKVIVEEMNQMDQELDIQEDVVGDDEFYSRAENIKGKIDGKMLYDNRPKSSLTGKRPVSGKVAGAESFFKEFKKYTSFNALDTPYEELFDRNERTITATFAKFGDLGYYSPVQRIGSYMQYSAKLKTEHLLEIVSLQQTSTNIEKPECEIPIQLAIIDELNPYQKKSKTGISTTFTPEDMKREPVSLSLFPEYFPETDENQTPQDSANVLFFEMLQEMGGTYDPSSLGIKKYHYIDPVLWPQSIANLVDSSVKRYNHYIESDIIRSDEIPKFRKNWMVNAFNLIPQELLKNEFTSRQVFQEIFENFKTAMKTAMLDYILRSPQERARLHIQLVPRKVLCSGERIAREGGFNINLYQDWHNFVELGREYCRGNLVLMNIINSSLQSWSYEFSSLSLFEYEAFKRVSTLGYTYNIEQFTKLQQVYRTNVISLMKNIWHRGAITIIKKFKFLRRVDTSYGKWTLGGFKKHIKEIKFALRNDKMQQRLMNTGNIEEIAEEEQYEEDSRQSHNRRSIRNPLGESNRIPEASEGSPSNQYYGQFDDNHHMYDYGEEYDEFEYLNESLAYLIDIDNEINTPENVYFQMLKYKIEREVSILDQKGGYTNRLDYQAEMNQQMQGSQNEFDFYDDIQFEDLKDIRDNSAYRKIAQKTMEDEQVWREENGWSLYTKEYKSRILDNVGILMGLQLRKIIEDSFAYLEKKFISYPTYRRWKAIQVKKKEVGSLDFIEDNIQSNCEIDEDDEEIDASKSGIGLGSNAPSNDKSPYDLNGLLPNQNLKSKSRLFILNQSINNVSGSVAQNSKLDTSKRPSQMRLPSNNQLGSNQTARPLSSNRSKAALNADKSSLAYIPQDGVNTETNIKTLIQLYPKDSQIFYKKAEFMKDQDDLSPILSLSLYVEDEQIKFRENSDLIKNEFRKLFNDMVTSFDQFLHPRYCKVKLEKNQQNLQRDTSYISEGAQGRDEKSKSNQKGVTRKQFMSNAPKSLKTAFDNVTPEDFESNCQDRFDEFYKKFCSFVQVQEKQAKVGGQQTNTQTEGDDKDAHATNNNQNDEFANRILNSLVAPGQKKKKFLQMANFNEAYFAGVVNRTITHVLKHLEESTIVLSVFDQFKPFIEKQAEREIRNVINKKQNMTNDEFKNYYEILEKFDNLSDQIPDKVKLTLFDVRCTDVKQYIKKQIKDLQQRLIFAFEDIILTTLRSVTEKYSRIGSFIRKSTTTADEVEEMEKFLTDLTGDRIQIKLRTSACFQKIVFLQKLNVKGNQQIADLAKDVHEWPEKLDKELIAQEEKHQIERQRIEEKLREKRTLFENRVSVYLEDLKDLEKFTEYYKHKDYIVEIDEFERLLNDAKDLMEDINDQEKKLFGISSNFEKFFTLQQDFEPYQKLWRAISVFSENKKKWMGDSASTLDSSEAESIVKEHNKISSKLLYAFKSDSIASTISQKFKEEVTQMGVYLPVIEIISRPGIQKRHWDKIQKVTQSKFSKQILKYNQKQVLKIPDDEFNYDKISLKYLLAKGIQEKITEVEEISENASKEFALETALDKMEKEWENLSFQVINWKNRGVFILQGSTVEDIQILLDDHTLKAQTIRANPNIRFAEQRAVRWEKLMLFIQSVLENWIKVQTLYLYLEPIFSFEDISKTLVTETDKFNIVNKTWKQIMECVQNDPKVLSVEKIPNVEEEFIHCLKLIEEIQKGLEEHLEQVLYIFYICLYYLQFNYLINRSKRLEFPRFFFLSNDDLLNILAETRDPLLVQPHMKKCFEGISELLFNYNVDITGMRSSEKEEIQFLERISPRNFKSNVEKWLLEVEKQMRTSLSKVMEEGLLDLQSGQEKRSEWVRKWPGQVVIAISQLIWTESLEESLNQSGLNGLKEFYEICQSGLEEIVTLVRQNLTYLETITLGALIVIEVHNKDVVKRLIDDEINNTQQFEWLSEMRYYWDASINKLNVKMMSTSMRYGYEYLGNTGRLVITPLTDRCYRTLMNALQLNLGGAPEGPAGTGKTESTKDLAKAIAMQCIVFNCSDGLNIHAMAKFFKGLIATGAWSCFDEFNRIDLEVLSVIAQQILQIQQCKAAMKTNILFEGTELVLKHSCNVFITMNPGYAGRSELPDNLKALFRPVAMMVPDYSLIAEISLYSFGFVDARNQARKIVAVYKLCSEQLSSQDHYDYGMRAVKAVLTAASQLKRKYPNEREDVLVLRSITDVNLPKFLQQDVDLFKNITSDLFPGVKLPNPDYNTLNTAMTSVLSTMNLQSVQNFRKKVLQLYEVVNTRHGLMLVGQPFSGKSSCYKVLAATLTYACKKLGSLDELPTNYYIINPKSISLNFLYGYSDPVSKEWTEGVLAEVYRKCATATVPDRQFIVFDGPVDADWIENMNTVLDDNKKLCLMSGETIPMSNSMTMMFEVADLRQASPATVSRCGMVYMQPEQLGWWPLVLSWLSQLSEQLDEQLIEHLNELFDATTGQCVHYVKTRCKEYQNVPEGTLVVQLMRLLKAFLHKYKFFDKEYITKVKVEVVQNSLDMIFIYCTIWSLGATIDEKGRQDFDRYLKQLIKNPQKCESKKDKLIKFEKQAMLPEAGPHVLVYDYYLELEESGACKWKNYQQIIDSVSSTDSIPADESYHNIVIKTAEQLRLTELLQVAIQYHYPFLVIGQTGTGKSTYINTYLKSLSHEKYLLVGINFSAQTSSEETQLIVDSKLDRRRKGIFGPPIGVNCLVFVDDLNMPQLDKYGAQPPIELLRQFLDQKGWYGKDRKFMEIIETSLIGAMGPPGGGRNQITSRLLRHFNVLCTTEPNQLQMERIFSELMSWYMNKIQLTDENLRRTFKLCIEATVEMYMNIVQNLKPTPAKCHYLFNLRDVSRVVQGLQLISKNQIENDKKIIRLWINEVSRVFYDRLSFEQDQVWFYNALCSSIRNKIKEDIKMVMKGPYDHIKYNLLTPEPIKVIRFGELMGNVDGDRFYDEMIDMDKIFAKVEYFLEDYNQNNKRPMTLVLFEFAIGHIINICRILRLQGGHGLLIGLGGSGRQSLTYLSAHIRDLRLTQIEMSKSYQKEQWIEDMRKLMIQAGVDSKESVFVINDSQMSKSFILEDLNNLLNSGDIPNLFSQEDFIPVIDRLRQNAKKEGKVKLLEQGTNQQFYDYFVQTVKKKLHIIITQSPIGDTLRNRIRNFPNIVNCTNIIWYKQWPEEALDAVGHKLISELYLDGSISRKLVNTCKHLHQSSLDLSQEYLRNEKRVNYITPSSYLELLHNLKILLQQQRKKLEENRNVYSNGVQKLISTAEQVKRMEEELIEKKPILIQMNEETQKIASEIKAQALAMEPKRIQAEKQEEEVNIRVQEAELIKQDCERELSVAKPQLKKAEDALNTLDSNDINKMKAMLKPPETVQLVMEAVCVLCKVPPLPVPNPKYPKERIMSYWEASKKFLSDKYFLNTLIQYDKENIDEQVMKKVRDKYISQTKLFNPKRVEQASSAAKGLCEWILALSEFEKVLQIVRPKQQRYNQSKQEVAILQNDLKQTRDELAQLNKEIANLQDSYDQIRKKQQQLEEDILDCEKKLLRASSLIGGLGGEQERWLKVSEKLENQLQFVVGDITISTGIISYLGPFSQTYRNKQVKAWIEYCKGLSIQISDGYSLESTLGEPIIIRKWNMNGLPSDAFSRENGIITYNTRRWPLMIDPQQQANRWIRKNEFDNKVTVVKQSDSNFIRSLETCIQFGQCLIIENVKEEIDSILDPILSKQTFKNAGVLSIKVGDNIVDYSKQFKLFLTSKLRNPHFTPEISTKLTLINFTITKEGLEDQLLEICVQKENPSDENQRVQLIIQNHKYQQQLEDIEKQILEVLNKADNILDDEQGVQVLQQSKQVSNDIMERQEEAKVTEQRLEQSRQEYKPIANHSAVLFFAIMDMASQDFMYQYSLNWFINLYIDSFDKAEKSKSAKAQDRVIAVSQYLTYSIYSNVCRSLFEKDKLLFSFLLLLRIQENKKHIDNNELNFLISPIDISSEDVINSAHDLQENPAKSFLPHTTWLKIVALSRISPKFKPLPQSISDDLQFWHSFYFDSQAHNLKLPVPFNGCTQMQKLCIIKAIRPDRVNLSVQDFIRADLGEKFTSPPPFNLQLSFNDSNCYQPLIFILPGTDPMNNLINFADQKQKYLKAISLGQGQGVHAEKAIDEAQKQGTWVILQNCHLAPSWMPKLEKICEEMQNNSQNKEKINVNFRLWLTSYPSSDFPISILQNSVKMTNEPPKGVKSNMLVSFMSDQIQDQTFFETHSKPKQFKTLLYGLCFFHAVLQERRTYGPLGWNILYDFNQSDLRISVRQLYILLQEYQDIPYKALHYMVGECNYGGRVTDDRDRRILHALMQDFFSDQIFQQNFCFASDQNYSVPPIGNHADYIKFIEEKIPLNQSPSIFGFHDNGVIVKDLKETDDLCGALLMMMGGNSMSNAEGDTETQLRAISQDILAKIPKKFDPELVSAKYPISYENSLNTVLQQEIIRYNNLTNVIVSSLKEIENALQGIVVMSSNLEKVCNSLLKGLVPDLWKKSSYPSLKPLGSYITDLVKRLKYYQNWIDHDVPKCHWISGFYFTQTFLTATLQNFARKYTIPIDNLIFEFNFYGEPPENVNDAAQYIDIVDGQLMYGLYIEGCKWDYDEKCLTESDLKVLSVQAPIIWLKPIEISQANSQQQIYKCPVYKTSERKGTLSTTGHSTNFIMSIDMPTAVSSSHWVKRGVAMLCQLSD
ncbi:hypothetical protein ABPG74_002288 [Tetrahymena malaccensis]